MPSRGQRGFTLLEITVSMALLGILSVVGANLFTDSLASANKSNRLHAVAAESRYAMERLSREIRGVQYDSGSQSFAISTATPTHMVFAKSGVSDVTDVEIEWVGTSLMLGYPAAGGPVVLIDHVSALVLDYKDADFLSTKDVSQVRFVDIVWTRTAPQTPQTPWRTLVALRGF